MPLAVACPGGASLLEPQLAARRVLACAPPGPGAADGDDAATSPAQVALTAVVEGYLRLEALGPPRAPALRNRWPPWGAARCVTVVSFLLLLLLLMLFVARGRQGLAYVSKEACNTGRCMCDVSCCNVRATATPYVNLGAGKCAAGEQQLLRVSISMLDPVLGSHLLHVP